MSATPHNVQATPGTNKVLRDYKITWKVEKITDNSFSDQGTLRSPPPPRSPHTSLKTMLHYDSLHPPAPLDSQILKPQAWPRPFPIEITRRDPNIITKVFSFPDEPHTKSEVQKSCFPRMLLGRKRVLLRKLTPSSPDRATCSPKSRGRLRMSAVSKLRHIGGMSIIHSPVSPLWRQVESDTR